MTAVRTAVTAAETDLLVDAVATHLRRKRHGRSWGKCGTCARDAADLINDLMPELEHLRGGQ